MSAPTLLVASDLAIAVACAAIGISCARLLYRNRRTLPFTASLVPFAILALALGAAFLVDSLTRSTTASGAAVFVRVCAAVAAIGAAVAAERLASGVVGIVDAARGSEQRRADLERRRAELEEAARLATAGETRFRALLEAAPDATITVDVEGRITLVNSQTEALFAYRRDELVGQPIEILLPDQLRELHRRHRGGFYEQPRRRPMGVGMDLVARRKDGSQFPTEISLSPLHTDAGLAVIVVVRDITERKKAEEERAALLREQAARTEAEAANRAKDEFVAVVSHELRTPLNAILGWATLLRSRSLAPDVADHALQAIERNAYTQKQVIDDLLDVSRMITGKISLEVREIDLAQVIGAAVDSVRPAFEAKHLHLDVILDPTLSPILGDARRLQQVLWNLLSNALKFTPAEGSVRISAVQMGPEIEVQVADSGAGIDGAFLPHVFDRFRQRDSSTTRAYGGLGLGLAIVRQLVEMHGGTVRAESGGEGHGSTFTVMLPVPAVLRHQARHGAVSAEAGREAPPADLPDLRGVRVLVVDDDAETRELLKTVLSGAGAQVTVAASGAEALLDLAHDSPDVLMSDIAMPQLDGLELIRQVRQHRPSLPSIALTAYGSIEDRQRAEAAGFHRHITKPVLPSDLLTIVATAARGSRHDD